MPRPYITAQVATRLSVADAALKAARCRALRSARHTPKADVARSSRASGRPKTNSAARLKATEATGASTADRPGVTIGQMSPSTIMAAPRTEASRPGRAVL